LDVAIVGLPQSGKSTLFAALAAGHASATADARAGSVGVVKLPDERLYRLAALVQAKKVTPIEVALHDLPALFERGAAPSGPAAETLSRAEALLHVVWAFDRPDGDPATDVKTFDAELMLFDLGIIERRLEKLDITVRSGRPDERESGGREQALLQRCKQHLEREEPLRDVMTDAQDVKALSNFGLLSLKPMLCVLNLGEEDAGDAASIADKHRPALAGAGTSVVAICAKLEAELAELSPDDAAEFRREMGVEAGATDRVLAALQELLALITFFTAGEKETRAWTLPAGGTALQAAGRIHTDIERGFIRAEVIAWDKLLELGSHVEARKVGQLRTEGKQYLVHDGDVINVLFNV